MLDQTGRGRHFSNPADEGEVEEGCNSGVPGAQLVHLLHSSVSSEHRYQKRRTELTHVFEDRTLTLLVSSRGPQLNPSILPI